MRLAQYKRVRDDGSAGEVRDDSAEGEVRNEVVVDGSSRDIVDIV